MICGTSLLCKNAFPLLQELASEYVALDRAAWFAVCEVADLAEF